MPICKTCNEGFPNIITVNGKQRNLSKRSRCLNCVPFQDGIRCERSDSQRGEKTCLICGKRYHYDRKNRKGYTTTKCNSCSCNAQRNAKKIKAVEYLGGKCVVCGYERCIQALSFHHTDDNKDFTISNNYGYSWEVLKEELDKCILVCQNCHQEIHYGITILTSMGL